MEIFLNIVTITIYQNNIVFNKYINLQGIIKIMY